MRRDRIPRHYIQPLGKIKAPRTPRLSRPWRRAAAVILAGASLLCGCATAPRLEPLTATSEPGVTLTEGGVRLTVLPNTWSAYPADLWRWFTPVHVRIENQRSDELQIRYEDFVALDEGNRQYRPVPPGEVARAMSVGLDPRTPGRQVAPVLLAGPWYRPYGPGYWGPYYRPWWFADPYYYPYAWPRPFAQDVLTLGLREGRLLAGASVEGFLFFQHATAQGNALTLSWSPHLAGGASLATLSARFRIVR